MKKLTVIIGIGSLLVGFFIAVGQAQNIDTSERSVETVPGLLPVERTLTAAEKRQLARILPLFAPCEGKDGVGLVTCVDGKLKDIARTYGARAGLDAASAYAKDHPVLTSYSHDLSHTVGLYALAYEYTTDKNPVAPASGEFSTEELVLIDRMGKALVDCYSWGVMGCMHGVIEGGIAKLPKDKRTSVVRRACMENPLIQTNQVYKNHCLHWAGHGMAIFTDQNLSETLTLCESLSPNFETEDVQLCLSGVFHAGTFPRDMEKKYLDNLGRVYSETDVYYPCRNIPERFRRQCYNAVPGRSRDHTTATIFANCHAIPEKDPAKRDAYIQGCYDAASNILSVRTDPSARAIVAACREYAQPQFLAYCYAGALRYTFLRNPVASNREPAAVCALAEEQAKKLCYTALGAVIHESFYSREVLEKLCRDFAEPAYYTDCVTLREY